MFRRSIRRLLGQSRNSHLARAVPRKAHSALTVESLEDRLVPAVFNVNSLADLLTPPSGAVTLRSAIQQANQIPGSNTINLTLPGAYKISTLGTVNETDNAAGEFAYTGTSNLTIVNTSGGSAVINGGGINRVFDINPVAENTTPFTVTFQGITITGGAASPGDGDQGSGGGIRAQGAASVVLNNVILTGNTATADGGGISLESVNNDSIGTLTVNASTISYDHAGDAGGGIETDGTGQVTVNAGSVVDFNTCVNQGAGIWLDAGGANLIVTGTVLSNNDALTMLAGGIGNAGAGNVTIANSLIQNNFSGGTGGGFGDAANMGNLTIQNSTFLDNSAAGDGGGVQEGGTQTTITGSVFVGNVSAGNGGGLFVNGQTVSITNTVFRQNTATSGGGIEDEAAVLTVASSTFDTNRAMDANGGNGNTPDNAGNGGGLEADTGVTSVTVSNCLFLNNVANDESTSNFGGGGIYDNTGDLTVSNSQFAGNAADEIGGALLFGGNSLNVTGSTFDKNHANDAGAIFVSPSAQLSNLINDTFVGNVAQTQGGALDVHNFGTVILANDTITGNTAATGGGVAVMQQSISAVLLQNDIVGAQHGHNLSGCRHPCIHNRGRGRQLHRQSERSERIPSRHLDRQSQSRPAAEQWRRACRGRWLRPGSSDRSVASRQPRYRQRRCQWRPNKRRARLPQAGRRSAIGAYEPQYATTASANQILVENLFEVLLNRLTDPGSAGFVNELNNGTSASTVALQIEGSNEYLGDQVQLLYQRYLHRQADSGGLQSFVSQLSHGATLEQVAAVLVGSTEYFQLHGGNNAGFLTALYLDALGRAPDPFGQDNFTQMLAAGTSRTTVALAVFTSQEFQTNLVGQSFQQYLGRAAFPEDLTNFTGMMQHGLTDQDLVAILLGSTEFSSNRT